MFCTSCGASIAQGVHFCPSCGRVVFRPAEKPPVAVRAKNKSNPLLTFGLFVLIILIVVGVCAIVFSADRTRFGFTLWTVYVFETLTGLFVIVTIIPLIFIGFKKYVLPKLRHSGVKQHKFLSKMSRKFSRHK